mgnify:CR=1 FL=1
MIYFFRVIVIFMATALLFSYGTVQAQKNSSQKNDKQENKSVDLEWIDPPEAHFTLAPSVDPFKPFVYKETDAEPRKKEIKNRELTPLEKVNVSQLRLVGIMWHPDRPSKAKAMVQLPDGKGYMLKVGTKVGQRSGKVVRITQNKVVVRVEVVDFLGKTKKKDVSLKVRDDKEKNS